MSFKRTIALIIILVALGTYFYLWEVRGTSKSLKEEEVERIFPSDKEDVEEVELIRGSEIIRCRKTNKGWQITAPFEASDIDDVMSDLLSDVGNAVMIEVIDTNPSNLADYGLDRPRMGLSLKFKDDPTPKTLLLGDSNPNRTCIYAKFEDLPEVILVGSLLKHDLETGIFALKQKRPKP